MPSRSWTDDLPKCQSTGVAFCHPAKELQTEEYLESNEFRCFYCQLDDDTCLYGVFDAHNGCETAQFVLQRMAAEILLGQLTDKCSDEEIKEVLRNAFLSVEKAYTESIDGLVAERTSLQFELPDGVSNEELEQNYGDILERLKNIDERLSIGATSVVALIHCGKLYVANVGNSRALLCKTDDNYVLRVVQLSVDHSLSNEDELLRLTQLGLDPAKLREAESLGNQSNTRCLGNYLVKGLYRAFPDMRTATSEPVIALPEVHGPILLDESCRFLVLVSDGLYKSLQESTDTEQVNKRFAQMVVEQLRTQASLMAVCQAVIDQTMSIYHEYCSQASISPRRNNRNTLLIRNFNFQLPNAPTHRSPLMPRQKLGAKPNPVPKPKSPTNAASQNSLMVPKDTPLQSNQGESSLLCVPNDKTRDNNNSPESLTRNQNNAIVRFNPIIQSLSHSSINDGSDFESYTNESPDQTNLFVSPNQGSKDVSPNQSVENFMSTITSQSTHDSNFPDSSSNTDTSSDLYPNNNRLLYDKNRKIKAYVDFSQYYENVEKARQNGTLHPSLTDL